MEKINEKDGVDFIECKICGKKFKQLNHRHLKECHNMTTKEYKEKYNIKSLTSKNYSANREKTFLERYGSKNQFGRSEIKEKIDYKANGEKIKNYVKEKYGLENISQVNEIKDKKRNTFMNKYGVPTNLNLDTTKENCIKSIKLNAQNRKISGEYNRRKKESENKKYKKNKVHLSMITLKKHLKQINPKNTNCLNEIMKKLGFSFDELTLHLQSNLPNGVSWDDFIQDKNTYSLDHIIPKSAYLIEEEFDKEFCKCWNLRNLRIITISDNSKKHNKIDWDLINEYQILDLLPKQISIA